MDKAKTNVTIAELLAEVACDHGDVEVGTAIASVASDCMEDILHGVEFTEKEYDKLYGLICSFLEDYRAEADALLREWGENWREEQEVREEGLRG